MRYLTIVRHAKAERCVGSPVATSIAQLNDRGRRQCETLRAWASDKDQLGRFGPTTALVSAAARTEETYRRAFEGTAFADRRDFSELIYNGLREVTAEDVLIDLAAIDPVTTSLLVVGHNPTVLELLAALVRKLAGADARELSRSPAPSCWRCPTTSRSVLPTTSSSRAYVPD